MCGRYTLAAPNPALVRERFALGADVLIEPRFNIAPGQDVVAVTTDREGARRGDVLRWGLVPHWAESPKVGYRMINARAETVRERPAFRDAFERRRCLIVADGFYEWQPREHVPKQPWWISRADGTPFAFAGLWATWRPEPGVEPLRTCTIITTQANDLIRDIHARMPVILPADAEAAWLDAGSAPGDLQGLLAPLPAAQTARRPVGRAVNDAGYDAPDCIEAVEPEPDEPAAPALF
jgi:putative SOS response-associated peptidase YedK